MGDRANFGSKLGVILATAGSAVGLGNVWRFPYMAGQNGGAAFILIYVGCVLLLGIPCMVSEFIIGRHAQANTARAYHKLSNGTPWALVGFLGVLTGFLITGYYAVVSGWCLQYIYASVAGQLKGSPEYITSYFQSFSQDPFKPILWTVVILLTTHFVVSHGVERGIERASKLLMPTLFILLLVIVVASCMLPGGDKGIEFLLKPNFSVVDKDVFLGALGQSFYSMSIAMGCLCTYASYFNRHTNLVSSAVQIGVIDCVVAILAGLMIFPAAFSVGVNADSGPSLIFMSTAFFSEELHISRSHGAWIVTGSCIVIGAFCSLSLGHVDMLQFYGKSLFDWFDFITGQIMLPVGGFFTSLFVGWYIPKRIVHDQFTNWGTLRGTFFGVFLFCVRYVCPICILLIFLHQLGAI